MAVTNTKEATVFCTKIYIKTKILFYKALRSPRQEKRKIKAMLEDKPPPPLVVMFGQLKIGKSHPHENCHADDLDEGQKHSSEGRRTLSGALRLHICSPYPRRLS